MHKQIATLAFVAASALALGACASGDGDDVESVSPSEFPAGSTMAALAEAGTITIGTKFDQPLFGLKAPSGDPEGFDVEMGKIIAAELGIAPENIEWVESVSANREPFIQDGTVDIVIATYTINDERKELVSFAGPYYLAGQSLMVLSDNTDITGPDDLAGKNVCSVEGSTPAQNIEENYPEATLKLFEAYTDCLEPLRNGQVDVVTTDNVILAGYVAESDGEFMIAGDQFTEEPYGIGLALDDTEFRMWINDVLEASFEDGRWLDAWNATAGTVLPEPTPPTVDRY
jgi:glutamate transport system substrate-binding protein